MDSHVELSKRDDDLADLMLQPVGTYPALADRARYDHSKKNWHLWDGVRWKRDDTTEMLDEIRRRALSWVAIASPSQIKVLAALFDTAKKESVLRALASRPQIAMTGDEWDQHPYLLGCRNGLVDLRDGSFSPTPDPSLMVTRAVNAKWNPGAECPRFLKFVKEIMGGDDEMVVYLLRMLGYSLFGWQREQKFWMWVGQGNNGKGTLAKVMSSILNDYADTPSDTLYMKTRFGSSKSSDARADLVRLQGKRWTWMSEPQGGSFNDELIKAHTGDDPIQARALYSNAFVTFRPSHTIVFLTNNPPKVEDVGQSMRRRVRLVWFLQDFSADGVVDRDLEDKLKSERDGILQLLVRSAGMYLSDGLPEPESVTRWSSEYMEENDPLGRFVHERCVVEPGVSTGASLLYGAYCDWARSHDVEEMSQTGFGIAMSRRFKKMKTRNGAVFSGVKAMSAVEIAESGDEDD